MKLAVRPASRKSASEIGFVFARRGGRSFRQQGEEVAQLANLQLLQADQRRLAPGHGSPPRDWYAS